MSTVEERIAVWREDVREYAYWLRVVGGDSMLVTFNPVRVAIHADGRATAMTPNGTLDLTTEAGLRELAEHTELREAGHVA